MHAAKFNEHIKKRAVGNEIKCTKGDENGRLTANATCAERIIVEREELLECKAHRLRNQEREHEREKIPEPEHVGEQIQKRHHCRESDAAGKQEAHGPVTKEIYDSCEHDHILPCRPRFRFSGFARLRNMRLAIDSLEDRDIFLRLRKKRDIVLLRGFHKSGRRAVTDELVVVPVKRRKILDEARTAGAATTLVHRV